MSRSIIQFAVDEIVRDDIDEFAGNFFGGEMHRHNNIYSAYTARHSTHFRGCSTSIPEPCVEITSISKPSQSHEGRGA